ncbi:SET domain-containing protein-lysine N-methyltransferase [Bradyrhizobium sp. NAS96.2]|uniref:SET domain-containing protein-lysine N-methyltransferase n=1 Tax=Bradyrhizobium sp. NAS96.2 TaxID=1680160 RepID=UPI000A936826|nr:SET domain-containing protein-lysine N-methyltransferase [Bradyrhizobium sp. NAS96.2]
MLIVETYIAPSKIHGLGVFAAAPLKVSTCIWVFDQAIDQEIKVEQLGGLPDRVRNTLLSRCFVTDAGQLILSRDNGVFLNHTGTPNLSSGLDGCVAIRDIARDEELTEDYRLLAPGACRAFLDRGPATPAVNSQWIGIADTDRALADRSLPQRLAAATGLLAHAVRLLRRCPNITRSSTYCS